MTTRLAIVTGTSSGIGAAVARSLVHRAWTVVGISRRPADLKHDSYHHIATDLATIATSPDNLRRELAQYFELKGLERIGLVNNAALVGQLGPLGEIDPAEMARVLAVNTVAPTWLMAQVMRRSPRTAAIRIVNVSTGAAVGAYPGIGAYAISKAALRMAGMSLASEWDAPESKATRPRDAAILSYEPGLVDTDMQKQARERPLEDFPWDMFRGFAREKLLVPPDRPAADIFAFLDSDKQPSFSEKRLNS